MHALFTGLIWVDIVSYGWGDRSIQDIVKKNCETLGWGSILGGRGGGYDNCMLHCPAQYQMIYNELIYMFG